MNIIIQDKDGNKRMHGKHAIIMTLDKEGQVHPHISRELGFYDTMQLLQTVQLHIMEMFSKDPKTGEVNQAARESIWDDYNTMASSLLHAYIPDKDLRPDLTEEAILAMENQLMDEAYEKKQKEENNG